MRARNSQARGRVRAALEAARERERELGVPVRSVELRLADARQLLDDAEKLAGILEKLEADVRALERRDGRRRRA